MKKHFFISIFIFISCKCFPAYIATYLPELIKKSDMIMYGRIISVEKKSFKIIVLKKIKPSFQADTLTIQKFENWSCAARYTEYQPGQEAVFFLVKNKNNVLETMGAANEGELVVRSDTAYIPSHNQEIFESKKFDFLSKYQKFISINLNTVFHGVKIYLANAEAFAAELREDVPGTVVYQYNTIEKLPENYFLEIVIDQEQKGWR